MIVRKTTPEEGQRVNELFAIAFELPLETGPANPENDRICHFAAFTDDNKTMMSTLSVTDYQIQFDGHSCKMGGMGGAASLPQYRRAGGIRGCFQAALADMYARDYDFSYLYPFSTAYYRKYGYECCVQKYMTTVQLGLLNPPPVSGVYRLAEKNEPMTDAIRAIDRVWESRFNMMVQHGEADYEWTKKIDPAANQEFTYVYFDAEQAPKAYTTFKMQLQPDGRNLVCSRFFFVDREGFQGLMHLFKSMASDHMYVKFCLPTSVSMQYLMGEWSLGAAQWSIQPYGMVRVVNVRRALEKARYLGSGSVTLEILDGQIPENNGRFAISFAEGRAVSVEKTDADADAVLTVPTFSALLSGVSDLASAAQWMDGLQVKDPGAPLDRVFYRKNLMIVDYF